MGPENLKTLTEELLDCFDTPAESLPLFIVVFHFHPFPHGGGPKRHKSRTRADLHRYHFG